MKKPLHEICNKTVEVMQELYGEPEIDSRMRIALFLAAQESIAKNMKRLNEKDVKDYVYYATVLNLYQLLGERAEKINAIYWDRDNIFYGYDAETINKANRKEGQVWGKKKFICLAGVWFYDLESMFKVLDICGIDAEFQKECARFGLGGA